MQYTQEEEADKRTRRIVITTLTIFALTIALVAHATDKGAVVECTRLAEQAQQYDDFYLPDWQRKMCDTVDIDVVVLFSPETREEMKEEVRNRYEVLEEPLPSNAEEMREWYQREAYAKEKALAYLNLAPRLQQICACESVGRPDAVPRHYEADGVTVLTGRITPEDKGMCQINEYFWGEKAESLGLDLLDPFDNVQMANYIYQQHGAQPWYPSRACHGYY